MNSSQIVRQELRAVVSGRSANGAGTPNNGIRTPQSPQTGGNTNNNNNQNNGLMMQQQQMTGTPLLSAPELDQSMRFNFDMSQGEISFCIFNISIFFFTFFFVLLLIIIWLWDFIF